MKKTKSNQWLNCSSLGLNRQNRAPRTKILIRFVMWLTAFKDIYRNALVALAHVALIGCATTNNNVSAGSKLPELNQFQSSGNISGSSEVFTAPYNEAPVSSRTQFFLVAAGADIANFIQEVVEQKQYWLSQGFSEEQIACYYVQPTKKNYEKDKEQFDALAEKVSGFRLASMQRIRSDLISISSQNPDFIYIYVTSHGAPPSYARKLAKKYGSSGKLDYDAFLDDYPGLDQYTIQFQSLPTGTADTLMQMHALRRGVPISDIHLTPAELWKTLDYFPIRTAKFVTLQACYSGGFIQAEGRYKYHTASSMNPPNTTALAAARFDRPSFGCSPGKDKTEFGAAYLNSLKQVEGPPLLRDWQALFSTVYAEVEIVEQQEEYSKFKPSEPVFFSNWRQWE